MNTREIMRALEGLAAATVGVYAADRIPNALSTPAAVICNTDEHTKPGSHWISIYIDKNREGIYFDSYGLPPYSKHHLDRLKKNCKTFRWNTKQLQSMDSVCCGQYAIMFLYHMCGGTSLSKFCKLFTHNTKRNDSMAKKFYKKILHKIKHKKCKSARTFANEISNGSGICNQTCTSRLRFN